MFLLLLVTSSELDKEDDTDQLFLREGYVRIYGLLQHIVDVIPVMNMVLMNSVFRLR